MSVESKSKSGATRGQGGPWSGPERLEVRKRIAAPATRVFAAWTKPESLARWMRPAETTEVRVEADVREGGRFTLDMVGADGKVFAHRGEYVVVDPPRKLAFTWRADWLPNGSLVTVEFAESDGATEVVLTHEGLPDAQSAENHRAGWGQILEKLAAEMSR